MKKLSYIALLPILLVLLVGCSQTKFVPKGEYLLRGVDIAVDNKKISKGDLNGVILQKPVRTFLGIPAELWVYNLSDSTGKTKVKRWFNKVFQKIGEPPVIFDSTLYANSLAGIDQYLNSKGYYNAVVKDTLIHRKGKFVKSRIHIKANAPYRLLDTRIVGSDTSLVAEVQRISSNSLLRKGIIFDSDILEKERERISTHLRNEGYFFFNKGYIVYEADSTVGDRKVLLNLVLKSSLGNKEDRGDIRDAFFQKYKVKEVNVFTNYEPTESLEDDHYVQNFSSRVYNGLNIMYAHKQNLSPELLNRTVLIRPDELYDNSKVNATYENLSGLKIFRTVSVQFKEVGADSSAASKDSSIVKFVNSKELVCNIYLTPSLLQSYKVEGELYLSSQIWGVAGNIGYSHLNIFKGAEQFNLNFNGSVDFLKGNVKEDVINKVNKSKEFGISSSVYIPRFLMPFNLQKRLKLMSPRTQFLGNYNYQNRPYYTRNLVSFGFGYSWKFRNKTTISYTPINLSIIKMSNDEGLKSYLEDRPLLAAAFSDHFISSGVFSIIYNTQQVNSQNSYFYSILNLEMAGNLLSAFNPAFKRIGTSDGKKAYSIWGMAYAQYVGSDYTVVYNQRLDSKNRLVYRFQVGAFFPYGNSSVLPYEKYFYVGGANSLRGWQVRALGPGAVPSTITKGQNDLGGDFRLEANFEYRYKLFWSFEGALFVDAGNVWFLPRDHQSSDATFRFNTFIKQIAANTGLGLRLNLGYFIARFDVGMKMVDPSKPYGSRFLFNSAPRSDYFSYHIGIGYPF